MHAVSTQLAGGVQVLQQEQMRVVETLGQVTQGVSALKQFQDDVRNQLAQVGRWTQSLSEMQGESRSILQRMQLLLAGTPHRGAAGESILREILSLLPAGLREENVRINNQVVEFAVKLPGDKFLPIDSKWPAIAQLEALETEQDIEKRSALIIDIDRAVARKAVDVAKYLDPDRTLMLGVAAVPDPIFSACTGAHVRAFQQGIIILPYSLAVPYVLSLLVLLWRFGQALDTSRLQAAITQIERSLTASDAELDGRFSRALTMLQNTQGDLRLSTRGARDALASLRISADQLKSVSHPAAPLQDPSA